MPVLLILVCVILLIKSCGGVTIKNSIGSQKPGRQNWAPDGS